MKTLFIKIVGLAVITIFAASAITLVVVSAFTQKPAEASFQKVFS